MVLVAGNWTLLASIGSPNEVVLVLKETPSEIGWIGNSFDDRLICLSVELVPLCSASIDGFG